MVMLKQYFSNQTKRTKQITSVLVVLIVAAVGTYLLVGSHAATPYASITADKGTLANGATKQSCSGTSDGSCVVFGSISSGGGACNLYASNSGNDNNSGSITSPLATLMVLFSKLSAGQTGCLQAGQTFSGDAILHNGQSHGAPGAPVTITSTDPNNPATISGHFVTETGADWITMTRLKFNYGLTTYATAITIGSKNVTLSYDDITAPHDICVNSTISSYGSAENTLIDHNRIHDCGSSEVFLYDGGSLAVAPNDGFYIHGVYDYGLNTTITNNYLYNNSDRGVQLRAGSSGAVVENNIMDNNGEGIIFGDTSTNATVKFNIITNNHSPCGIRDTQIGCYNYGATAFQQGSGNVLDNNDLFNNFCFYKLNPPCYPTPNNNIDLNEMTNITISNDIQQDPLYVNAAAHDYSLQPGSPAAGMGPVSPPVTW